MGALAWQGQATCPGGSGISSSPPGLCPYGFAFPMMWQEVGHLILPTCPCKYFCAMATLLGRFSASL